MIRAGCQFLLVKHDELDKIAYLSGIIPDEMG